MAVQVVMPTFGMTEGEAVIVRWLKAVGEQVRADEPLLEAETDKATLEVPSPADGVLLRLEVEAGESVAYKSVLGWIGQAGEQVAFQEPDATGRGTAGSQPEAVETGSADEDWVRASPIARRIARDRGLDLRGVQGSGPQGRVMEKDVLAAVAALAPTRLLPESRPAAPVTAPAPILNTGVPAAGEKNASAYGVVPLTAARRVTAARMAASFSTAPHFYLQMAVRAARLVALREELLPELEPQTGIRLSYTDFFLYALARLLPRHPLLNATWQEGEVRTYPQVHLAVAVATPKGLLVPVIRDANRLTLNQIMRERDRLTRAAQTETLQPGDHAGGTFTLTNLGMYGVDTFIPILNPPQSAILAVGAIADRAVGVGGQVVLEPTLNLTLAVDHRVADGAQAAEFARDLKGLLEAPARMLL